VLEGGAARATNETAVRGAQFSAPGFGTSGGVAFDTSVENGTATRYALALRQPLYSRERQAQGRELEIAADAAEREWTQAEQSLMLRSADAYIDAALAAESLRVLQRQQDAVDKALTEAEDRFRLGDRPVTDVHEARARSAALKAQRLAAQTALALSRARLADLTGAPVADAALALPGTAGGDGLGRLDDWLARAERGNAALLLARTRLDAAQARQGATGAALAPTVDLVARIGRDRVAGSGDFAAGASSTARDRAIGVQLSVPLYTGGMRSARDDEARAGVDKAAAELEAARRQVAQQTRAAWLDLDAGASRTAALQAALDASRARLDATRTGLQAGDRTTLDLLNAENDAAAAELALQQARAQLISLRLRLAALAGELDEAALRQANAALRPPPL
jgi:outer membrane protein